MNNNNEYRILQYTFCPLRVEETEEFAAWFSGLKDSRAKSLILSRILKIRSSGGFGDSKSVRDGVYELRFAYGPGYRVYFAWLSEEIVLLLNGGHKGTQNGDIARAKRIKDERGQVG